MRPHRGILAEATKIPHFDPRSKIRPLRRAALLSRVVVDDSQRVPQGHGGVVRQLDAVDVRHYNLIADF